MYDGRKLPTMYYIQCTRNAPVPNYQGELHQITKAPVTLNPKQITKAPVRHLYQRATETMEPT